MPFTLLFLLLRFAAAEGRCAPGEFACSSGNQCIPRIKWQDDVEDCWDGSDERGCLVVLNSWFIFFEKCFFLDLLISSSLLNPFLLDKLLNLFLFSVHTFYSFFSTVLRRPLVPSLKVAYPQLPLSDTHASHTAGTVDCLEETVQK